MDEKKAEIDDPSVTALSPAVVATDNDRSPDASKSKVSIRTGARSNQGKRSPTGSVKSTKSTTSDKASQTGSRKSRAQSVDHDTQTSRDKEKEGVKDGGSQNESELRGDKKGEEAVGDRGGVTLMTPVETFRPQSDSGAQADRVVIEEHHHNHNSTLILCTFLIVLLFGVVTIAALIVSTYVASKTDHLDDSIDRDYWDLKGQLDDLRQLNYQILNWINDFDSNSTSPASNNG